MRAANHWPCSLLALVQCLALSIGPAHAAIEVKDSRGKQITLTQAAKRVITLSPHLAELVYDAGGEDKLVAVSRFTDYPAALKQLPQVGDAGSLDFERLLALKPDLVLAWELGNRSDQITRMERLGIKVYVAKQPRLRDIGATLRTLGSMLDTQVQAESVAVNFEQQLIALGQRYANARPVTTFVEIWHQPLMTISAQHWIDEIVHLCGGRNVFTDALTLTPSVTIEALYAADPEAIVGGSFTGATQFITQWQSHSELRAVKNRQVHFVDPDLLQRATTRLIGGARQVCESLDRTRLVAR